MTSRDHTKVPKAATTLRKPVRIVRYGLYFADLNPTLGAKIAKIRPVVVVSPQAMNDHLETVVICPLTSVLHPTWRTRVPCLCQRRHAEIAVDQIRTLAKQRLTRSAGAIDREAAEALRGLIVEMYGSE